MTEEREHLQNLVEQRKKNIRNLEKKAAQHGLDCPLWITNELEHERDELAKLEKRLAALPLEGPVSSTIEAPAIQVKPCNLPSRGEFIGREKEKAQVREALASRSFLVTIDGIGGIGKTALALEVAHELWEEGRYKAVIWIEARRELVLSDILDIIARTLNYPYITQLLPEEKEPEVAKRLREQRCLLIVDSFETITDKSVVRFLLKLPEPSKALITSREQSMQEARD
jgi:predicted ATP-dependent serine protease